MKIVKFIVAAVVMISLSAVTFAQVSSTATASATIVTPITITKATDMNFGNVSVNASLGTVVITPAGARSRTGGVTLPSTTGTVSAATFTVSGQANYTYSITLPVGATTITSGANSMTVNTWTSSPSPTGTIGGGGSQTLGIGGTLNVAASQAAGSYTSATPFTVTVNYN